MFNKENRGFNKRDNNMGNGGAPQRKTFQRRKVCRYCLETELHIDYKEPVTLMPFLTDRGKIIPRRISGACAKHQRIIARAIKVSRQLALLPYADTLGD